MVEYYEDRNYEWRWRVKAKNGEIVADSAEGYKNKSDAEHGYQLTQEALREGV